MIRSNRLLGPVVKRGLCLYRRQVHDLPGPALFTRSIHTNVDGPSSPPSSSQPTESLTKHSTVTAHDSRSHRTGNVHDVAPLPSAIAPSKSIRTEPQKSIPGPTWVWLEPLYTPFRAYGRAHQRRPYMTQFVSTLVIYLVGDFAAQSVGKEDIEGQDVNICAEEGCEERGIIRSWADNRDWQRTGRALLIGGLAAVPGYKWFLWLSNSFNYSSKLLSLTVKVVVNQAVFTPVFNTYFFGMQHLLTHSISDISPSSLATHISNTVPTSWVNSCKLWPAVTAFMFAYVKLEYRSLLGGVIAIGWQTYLSLLDARARKAEREKKIANGAESRRPEQQSEGCGAASNEHQRAASG
ncbi:uncharacterized protein EI97DRAFT_385725 [Westerdykella ornata]|uniref:Uncharacterized protein n=1 Tax=Westerdykella ornata TaxID=318751 RepID=A0A6A6J758_WESOR|nr:uncharacterized protein EI97DRAFT_385725 [Westerdykella ornata]KAF2272410.1 hypothetical protein EI97DRAFT_385725 [Westerdykella ornata]